MIGKDRPPWQVSILPPLQIDFGRQVTLANNVFINYSVMITAS